MDPEQRISESAPHGLEGVARDASTLIEVLGGFERSGYSGQFVVREGARLECSTCHSSFGIGDARVDALRRLEGASDPDDMLAVAALACPECATQGTVVLGYGPASSAEDAAALGALDPPPHPSSTSA
jgi:hypothetical protein